MESKEERIFRKLHNREYEDHDSKIRHSRSYHDFFEGYSEELVDKKDGKGRRIQRTYVGKYYKRSGSDRAWVLSKVLYVVMFLAAAALYVFALTRRVGCNSVWYCAAPGLISVVPMIMMGAKLAACLVTKRIMVAYDYKYVYGRVFIYGLVTSGILMLTGLMMVLYIILNQEPVWDNLIPALAIILAACLLCGLGFIEWGTVYYSYENETKPGRDSVVIQEEL